MATIETIQFKRGSKIALEQYLVGSQKLLDGEPAFEKDTGQLKIGNGIQNYRDLPYVGTGGGGGGDDPRFVIHDPVANQVLLYDADSDKWVNRDLDDKNSIIYLAEHGLVIKGYYEASQGDMLVKDNVLGLTWVKPLSPEELQRYVSACEESKNQAGAYALQAGNSATAAETSAGNARRINEQTINWFNNKFWWGSIEEYNELPSINPETFYFIRAEE